MVFIRDARGGVTVSAMHGRDRTHITAALLLALACLTVNYAARAGDLDTVVTFNIDAQTIDKALLAFGAQAHVQIMFAWDSSTAKLLAHEVKGSYTGKAALAKLLQGTLLTYTEQGDTVEIVPNASTDPKTPGRLSKSLSKRRPADSVQSHNATDKNVDPPATQQPSASGQTTEALGEVIVTAQKYSQRAFDVPMSLVVLGSQQLQEEHIENLNDLQYYVPGLRVEGGGAYQRVTIRGVGNTVGNSSYVSEYMDDADMTSSGYSGATGVGGTDLQSYDLARVEVLRGPQGTLYGDSALGGTIRLITNKPVLNEFEMNSNVELPFTQYGAPSQNIEAMLNTPLITNTLGVRVAGEFDHDGGWIDEPAAKLKNVNGNNLTDIRIEGLLAPTSKVNVQVTQIVHREAYGLSQGEDSSGNVTPILNTTYVPNGQKNFDLSNLEITYEFDNMRLLSSSTYLNSAESLYELETNEVGVAVELVPNLWDSEKKATEELRLESTGAGSWRWLVGSFYDHDRSSDATGPEYVGLYSVPRTLSSLSTALEFPAEGAFSEASNSAAAFGDTSYTFADRLTVGAGARYYTDRETAVGGGYEACPCSATFTSTDPRAYVQYKINAHVNTYVSASKGFRTGGFNPFLAHPYGPESLWSYELGTKMKLSDDRVAANADVFLSDYSDYVVFAVIPAVSTVFGEDYNVGAARIKGFEGDISWRPDQSWLLSASGDYIDAKFTSIVSAALRATYQAGNEVPLSSKYQVAASAERDFNVESRPAYARVDFSVLSPQINYQPVQYSALIRMLGFDAGIRWNDNLKLGVFGQNLLNDRGVSDPFALIGIASRPRPRTVGIDFNVAFGGR